MKSPILIVSIVLLSFLYSCKSFQLAIPTRFKEQATQLPVKGWNSYKKLSFGKYATSKVKRGMFVTSKYAKTGPLPIIEANLNKHIHLEASNQKERSKDRFQYSIHDGNRIMEVLATEGSIRDYLQVKTGNRWLGDFSVGNNHQYTFSAVFIPLSSTDTIPWQLKVYNAEHPRVDSLGRKRLFRFPLEQGIATNGVDTITIKQIRVTNTTSAQGQDTKIPFEVPGGYELRMDDGVVAIINKWNHEVWIYNDLDESTKLVLSAVASSLMLRKINDMK